jgi:hypothetical protein
MAQKGIVTQRGPITYNIGRPQVVDLSYHTKIKPRGGPPMDNIIQLNQEVIKNQLGDLVRNTVEETLNGL